MSHSTIQWLAASLFLLALVHTFTASYVARLGHRFPKHHDLFHLFSEVEIVFGFWAMVLVLSLFLLQGKTETISYLESRNFTEPLFVFSIMVISASKPIIDGVGRFILWTSSRFPKPQQSMVFFTLCIGFIPLLGSFITEPAAMTVAALLLRQYIFADIPLSLRYATLATLFVNISIGGTLTAYAAPPILMVSQAWGWDSLFVFTTFGEKALWAVSINTSVLCYWFRRTITKNQLKIRSETEKIPLYVQIIHLIFLLGVIVFGHHPVIFIGILLFFLGFAQAYAQYQNRLILREALLVSFFLGGLIVLGGLQAWWLQPVLSSLNQIALFVGAIGLTAFTDNAALTYLGSLVSNTTPDFRFALVSGAVVGGGLTIVANAPNPVGLSILKAYFPDENIQAFRLLFYALTPTIIAAFCFWFL
jgi:hypothetical protein